MQPRIRAVKWVGDHRLELTFTDGVRGETDLREWVVGEGGVMKALEDPAFFGRVQVNDEVGTIEWPNGVDFCPDVLYSRVTGKPIPGAEDNWAMSA